MDTTASNNDEDLFYFESDHLALRGNADYSAVLKCLVILQTQKIQRVQTIDQLLLLEKKYLEDPDEFLDIVKSGREIIPIKNSPLTNIPKIDFSKYNVNFPNLPTETSSDCDNNDIKVRGRIFDQTKPETFNQLWTSDEQRRLEELLLKFPPEDIEMRRFAKIAKALGNRTTQQVASRVQKFFKKLYSAGMPIPGRLPKCRKMVISRLNKFHKNVIRPSTFFPAHDVRVKIPDDESLFPYESFGHHLPSTSRQNINTVKKLITTKDLSSVTSSQNDKNVVDEKKTENDMKILNILEHIKKAKLEEDVNNKHEGVQCGYCFELPICGILLHCETCTDQSIDFCSDCAVSQLFANNSHLLNHEIVRIDLSENENSDYRSQFETDYGNNEMYGDNNSMNGDCDYLNN